jgi:hypothetical protein
MKTAVRKSVRLPGSLMREIEAVNTGGEQFSTIVQKALRRWVRYQRRKAYGRMVLEAARQRSPEQIAEDIELVRQGSLSGQMVLEESERRG